MMPHILLGPDLNIQNGGLAALQVGQAPITGQEYVAKPTSWILFVACMGLCITGAITVKLILRLAESVPERVNEAPQRWLCSAVVMTAPCVCAVLYFISVFTPDHARMIEVMMAFYHCLAIYCIFQVLLGFLGDTRKKQKETFENQGAERMMWVLSPIVCFCCYSCMELRKPSERDLNIIWFAVIQFIVLTPVFACLEVAEVRPTHLFHILHMLSLFTFVYCVIVMIKAAEATLHPRKPHMKFWGLKGLIVMTLLVHHAILRSAWDDAVKVEKAAAWSALVTVPFAIIAMHAFPKRDLVMGDLEEEDDDDEKQKEKTEETKEG